MQRRLMITVLTLVVGSLLTAGAHEGCQKPTAKAKTKAKVAAKKAICATCAVTGGHSGPEEVKATLKYKGKQYAFCSLGCKAAFISSPAKYAKKA